LDEVYKQLEHHRSGEAGDEMDVEVIDGEGHINHEIRHIVDNPVEDDESNINK
jgi:hypothetical protein